MTKGWNIEQKHIQIGPASIYYEVVGAGQPVVLVHGLSGSTRWWQKNVTALAAHFRLYLIDLIGFGRSRSHQGFVLVEAPLYLKAWMETIGIPQADIIAYSMGGLIASILSADFPDMVKRLVLVNSIGLPLERSLSQQTFNMIQAFAHMPVDLLRVILADAYRAGFVKVLRVGATLLNQDASLKLARIVTPTLVVWGEHDQIVPLKLGRALTSRLSNSRLEVIQGVGHFPMWENVGEFNRLVIDFLETPVRKQASSG